MTSASQVTFGALAFVPIVGTWSPSGAPKFWKRPAERTPSLTGTVPAPAAELPQWQTPSWVASLGANVRRLQQFERGWDGPGSLPIDQSAISTAIELVMRALAGVDHARAPHLAPCADGSLIVEWRSRIALLEMTIIQDKTVDIWVKERATGRELEAEDEAARVLFARWAPRLASVIDHVSHVPPETGYRFDQIAA